jgi:CheY-like chemotaxis protein
MHEDAPPLLSPLHTKGRILVADDDETFGYYVTERLHRSGYDPVRVKTGSEAIEP